MIRGSQSLMVGKQLEVVVEYTLEAYLVPGDDACFRCYLLRATPRAAPIILFVGAAWQRFWPLCALHGGAQHATRSCARIFVWQCVCVAGTCDTCWHIYSARTISASNIFRTILRDCHLQTVSLWALTNSLGRRNVWMGFWSFMGNKRRTMRYSFDE